MDRNGRFETIEDALSLYHDEQWFTWKDHNNKIYKNIVVTNPDVKLPTEKELNDALAKQQSDFDAQEYARKRAEAYPSLSDQMDMIMKDNRDGTKTHQTACEAVKKKYPKG